MATSVSNDIKKRRKRSANTSTEQLEEYLKLMESDDIFRTSTLNPSVSPDHIDKCWEKLTKKLNSCDSGPALSTKEWMKRFNDWKNNTRAKYRKLVESRLKTGGGEGENITLSATEDRGLAVWGKVAVTGSNKVRAVGGLQNYISPQLEEFPEIEQVSIPTRTSSPTPEEVLQVEVNETISMLANEETELKRKKDERTGQQEITEHPRKNFTITKKIYNKTPNKNRYKENRTIKTIGEELLSEYKNETVNKDRLTEKQIELEIAKFRFEVAKYKFENPTFCFDVDL